MHAAVAYGIYYLCHGGCSDLRTFRKTLLSPHKMMIINSVTLSAYKKKISGDVPSARLSHKMYLIKPHTVFLAGGLGASGFCKDCFFINLLTMESVYAGDLPLPLGNFSIVECNSQVYLIGGQTDGFIVFPVFYKISFTDKREQTDRTDAGPPFNTADGTPPTSDAHAAANNRETKTPFTPTTGVNTRQKRPESKPLTALPSTSPLKNFQIHHSYLEGGIRVFRSVSTSCSSGAQPVPAISMTSGFTTVSRCSGGKSTFMATLLASATGP